MFEHRYVKGKSTFDDQKSAGTSFSGDMLLVELEMHIQRGRASEGVHADRYLRYLRYLLYLLN